MSEIGHGAYGFLSGRRSYLDLARDPSLQSQPRLDLQLGMTLTGAWTNDGGGVYSKTISGDDLILCGVLRAIVGVETGILPRPLARVERIADLALGTWYYDESAQGAGGSTALKIRLPAGEDPATTTVEILVLFTFSGEGEGEIHPIVGSEKLANPGAEVWNSSTDLDNANELNVGASGVAVTQETSNVFEGASAIKIAAGASGLAAGTAGGVAMLRPGGGTHILVAGCDYLLACAYWTSIDLHPDLSARLRLRESPVGNSLADDMISATASVLGQLQDRTNEEWARGLMIFRSPWDTTTGQVGALLRNTGGGAASGGYVLFDDFHFWRIHRYDFYAPRLSDSSIPAHEIKSQSDMFGPKTMTSGNVKLIDHDRELGKAFKRCHVFNKPAFVWSGGRFSGGQEILRDDWSPSFPALVRKPSYRDGEIGLTLNDARTLTRAKALQKTGRLADTANMEPTDEGKPKPLLFGQTSEPIIEATAVDIDASTGYRKYEQIDPLPATSMNVDVDLPAGYFIRSYPNKDLAERDEGGYDITDSTNDFTVSNNKTRWNVLRDIQVLGKRGTSDAIAGRACAFFFDVETTLVAAAFVVYMELGAPPYKVAADLQAAMRAAVGGGDTATFVSYSETTHKFTVSRTGGKGIYINLWSNLDGVNTIALDKTDDGWTSIGFDGKNKIGSATASWLAEKPVFLSAERNHFLRFVGGGYRDDTNGSICGVANAAIDSYPAIASFMLQKVLGVPASMIDVPSFKAARDLCLTIDFAKVFWMVKRGETDVFKILSICERGGLMDLILVGRADGSFVWRCKKYSVSTVGAVELFDRHYLDFHTWDDPELVYEAVRVYGGQNPALDRFTTWADGSTIDQGMSVKHGAGGKIFELEGALDRSVITAGTTRVAGYYGNLISGVPMVAELQVRGLLLNKTPGDKLIAWKESEADPLGSLGMTSVGIVSSSVSGTSTITTSTPHFLKKGQLVRISDHAGSTPAIAGDYRVVAVTGPLTFTIQVNVTVGGTGGTFVRVPVFRITGLKHDSGSGVSTATAIDDISPA